MTERPARKVLIYRLGSLGDTLVALPALHLIARAFPHAERRLLTNFPVNAKAPPAAAILEHTGLVHGFFRYTVATRSLLGLAALWGQLALWHPDVLIYLGSSRGVASARRDRAFFRLCGIRRLIGVPLTEDMQQPRRATDPNGFEILEPEASRLARNLAALGNPHLDDPANWDLHLTPQEHARAASVLLPAAAHPLIAVSVGTKVQANDWGRENWRNLLLRLAELYPQHALALTGTLEEGEASELLADAWRSRTTCPALNLCGAISPREAAAVFARAVLFLGHDSGPMHLAASVQTPCVAIFSARNPPGVWFPYGRQHRVLYHRVDCRGCHLETCIIERKKCIISITVDEVLAELQHILPNPSR